MGDESSGNKLANAIHGISKSVSWSVFWGFQYYFYEIPDQWLNYFLFPHSTISSAFNSATQYAMSQNWETVS